MGNFHPVLVCFFVCQHVCTIFCMYKEGLYPPRLLVSMNDASALLQASVFV